MSAAKRTPGPWAVREAGPCWEVWSEPLARWVAYAAKPVSDDALCGVYPTIAESAANARLIAATPEAHDLIEQLEESFTADGVYQQFLPAMRAYLNKVRGGSNADAPIALAKVQAASAKAEGAQ